MTKLATVGLGIFILASVILFTQLFVEVESLKTQTVRTQTCQKLRLLTDIQRIDSEPLVIQSSFGATWNFTAIEELQNKQFVLVFAVGNSTEQFVRLYAAHIESLEVCK